MTDPFRYYLRVRYAECDAQKVVFNSRYGDYLDIVSVEFLKAVGLDRDTEYQVVKQTVEWKSSGRFDDVLELSVAATHLGTTSFTLRTEIRRAATGEYIATGETVYVLVDHHTMQKTPMPPRFREALQSGARGLRIDHAGYLSGPVYTAAVG